MNRAILCLIVITSLLSACGPSVNIAESHVWRDNKPQVSDAELQVLVSGNNTFAFDLYQSLRVNEGNLVLSPYSISSVFAMTYAGARGETASQIASIFHFDLMDDRLHSTFNSLDLSLAKHTKVKMKGKDQNARYINRDPNPPQLSVVNTMWAQENYSFQTPFLDLLKRNYGAGIHQVDFVNHPDLARKRINSFVSHETNDMITDIIPEHTFNQDTGLVLINTIYFEADWQELFYPAQDLSFNLLDGSQIDVQTMELGEAFIPYAEGENWLAVELPYAGETFSMVIIVPSAGEFDEFETNMDYKLISTIISSLQKTGVELTMPKFELTNEFALVNQLKSLGISDAFDSNLADFSGMTETSDFYLSDTIHKTYISVNEEGTRAAAATGNYFMLINSSFLKIPVSIIIDRPFIFIIRDVDSEQFLFIGRVVNPKQ